MAETKQKVLVGMVVSNKMQKTISVKVGEKRKHPRYGKYMNLSRKFLAHVEQDEVVALGSKVMIMSCSRLSKNKSHKFLKVIDQ